MALKAKKLETKKQYIAFATERSEGQGRRFVASDEWGALLAAAREEAKALGIEFLVAEVLGTVKLTTDTKYVPRRQGDGN